MKKIFLIFAVMAFAVSCLSSTYDTQYTTNVSFDYDNQTFAELKPKPDSLLYDVLYKIGFSWDHVGFYHNVDKTTAEFKGGFLASNLAVPAKGASTSALTFNQYRANARNPYTPTNKYGVFVQTSDMPEKHFGFLVEPSAGTTASCTMKYVLVTNSVSVEETVRANFKDGDAVVLRATGYLGNQKTGQAEIKLAEYTEAKDSVMTTWTKFDLSPLGSIDQVKFAIDVPTSVYFPAMTVCMDNLVADISIVEN
jgi:hypothetical protein